MLVEAICVASGPSLTDVDLAIAKEWQGRNRQVIVTNTTFRSALWADQLFAMDSRWWAQYVEEAKRTFQGHLVTSSHCWRKHGLKFSPHVTFGNSGAGAINLAYRNGAKHIYLLGYDCQKTGGKAHHYGDHPKGLGNATSCHQWKGQFDRLAAALKGKCEIINASRETALKVWPRMELEELLADKAA